nr:MAG TPA: hypothetical protein [Caudoviricetes sp.]
MELYVKTQSAMFHGSVFVKQCVKIELILFHGYGVEF